MPSTDSTLFGGVAATGAASMVATPGSRKRHAERTLFLRHRLADVIRQHPGVADLILECRGIDEPWPRIHATIVPDARHAPGVLRTLEAQRLGLLHEGNRCILPDGMIVAGMGMVETEPVYRRIFQDRCFIKHGIVVKDGDCIVDVGARSGLFSLHVSRLANRLRMFVFEPNMPLYRLLQVNRAVCGLQNVAAFPCGLSRSASGMRTLSDVIAEHDLRRIDLLKIDAEKGGIDVLEGIADADWPKVRQVVAEVGEEGDRLDAIQDLLRRHGFQVVIDHDNGMRDTRTHMVYAMHADAQQAAARSAPCHSAEEACWRNNPDLLAADVRRHVALRMPDSCQMLEVVVESAV